MQQQCVSSVFPQIWEAKISALRLATEECRCHIYLVVLSDELDQSVGSGEGSFDDRCFQSRDGFVT